MSESSVEHLVKMANQIVANVPALTAEARIENAAAHMKRFWTPVMTAKLKAHATHGAGELSPDAEKAVGLI
ncbi:MAG: formate dehydrogenase subunit delta [Gammaproteobacteria bacterium]|nr:formate dehydrogenase subunit delta [Gammaproteobacteria bacterium]MBK9426343.1 formate dehydrogenase subunit delta [Gammaproteobacteria bacterium]